jgi:hypothetical protein
MRKFVLLVVLLLPFVVANSVSADCWYNGVKYAEGTVIGPYVCQGGEWVKK